MKLPLKHSVSFNVDGTFNEQSDPANVRHFRLFLFQITREKNNFCKE